MHKMEQESGTMRQRGRKAVTGRRIRVDSRKRRPPVGHGEGFLLATLLQSVLCAVMLALAFAASQHWGLTGIKSCFAAALSQETEAAEVFAAVQRARDSRPAGRLRDWISETIDAALGLGGHSVRDGKGGQLPADGDEPPSGMMAALPVLSAAARQPVLGELTSPFGYREHPITGQRDFHTGADLAAPEGTPIGAAYPGEVVEVGESEVYGNYVTLFHGGFATRYCHCAAITVREGMKLRQGETVALVGSTGMSTGPHLHFELVIQGKNADPLCGAQGWVW